MKRFLSPGLSFQRSCDLLRKETNCCHPPTAKECCSTYEKGPSPRYPWWTQSALINHQKKQASRSEVSRSNWWVTFIEQRRKCWFGLVRMTTSISQRPRKRRLGLGGICSKRSSQMGLNKQKPKTKLYHHTKSLLQFNDAYMSLSRTKVY